jgi:nucleoside-diphosphate-sugar epimerase
LKILVTGAAGFIGSTIERALLVLGHSVYGLDNLNDAYDVRLKDWRLLRARPPGHTIVSRGKRLNEGGASFGGR